MINYYFFIKNHLVYFICQVPSFCFIPSFLTTLLNRFYRLYPLMNNQYVSHLFHLLLLFLILDYCYEFITISFHAYLLTYEDLMAKKQAEVAVVAVCLAQLNDDSLINTNLIALKLILLFLRFTDYFCFPFLKLEQTNYRPQASQVMDCLQPFKEVPSQQEYLFKNYCLHSSGNYHAYQFIQSLVQWNLILFLIQQFIQLVVLAQILFFQIYPQNPFVMVIFCVDDFVTQPIINIIFYLAPMTLFLMQMHQHPIYYEIIVLLFLTNAKSNKIYRPQVSNFQRNHNKVQFRILVSSSKDYICEAFQSLACDQHLTVKFQQYLHSEMAHQSKHNIRLQRLFSSEQM